MVVVVLITALIGLWFIFTNGMNDAANCIASVVATKALSPIAAVLWAALFSFSALFVFDMTVATTMGKGIVEESSITVYVILAALLGAVIWTLICTRFGIPISTSHALIGGLIGPVWFGHGAQYLIGNGIFTIVAFIVISPLLGMVMGFVLNCIFMALLKNTRKQKTDMVLRKMQLVSSAAFALGYGGNDGQKTMGLIAVLLAAACSAAPDNAFLQFIYGNGAAASPDSFFIPMWLKLTCYGLISIGMMTGGWKVIRTLGDGLTRINPAQGFCAEASGAATLIITALAGIPVSTTHTVTGAIIGTGLTRGIKKVRWLTAKNIVWTWVITIPAAIVISGLIYLLMQKTGITSIK